jgi:hypothetical protein|tara:strand:- start:42 stop:281 length:240 start_codon:yes stop_codon:yes gene_type:complete
MTKNKLSSKQHRLRRVLKKNQNKIDAMGRDARKDINRFNELAVTGRVMKAMQNGAGIRVFLGTKQAHIQFGTRNSYEPF